MEAEPVEPIGIVLIDMPALLRDIVIDTIAGARDLQLLAAFPGTAGLVDPVRRTGAEVVVTAVSVATPERVSRLLRDYPLVRIVGITDDGATGEFYENRPHRLHLTDVSQGSLLEAIRSTRNPGAAYLS